METLKVNPFKSFNSARNIGVVFLLFLLVLFMSFYPPKDYSIFSCHNPQMEESKRIDERVDDLAATLEKASAGSNKTVILAVVNEAYVDGHDDRIPAVNMLDLFLESFWLGEETRPLIKHLMIVATDPTAYERCVFRGLHCYLLVNQTDGEDSTREKVFESKGFINMMWRRTFFLLTVLKNGYNFIFTDIDVMWLRNPFRRLNIDQTGDIKFSTDRFNGDPKSDLNPLNTGFYHVRSNNRTISLFERWFSMHDTSPGMKEQDVLQKLISDGVMRELSLDATFLDTRYFSGFCQESVEPRQVVTVHANCCRYIAAKVADLASVLDDWKRFKRLAMNDSDSVSFAWSPHVNCQNSWQH